ncbi:UDP-N-acetylglucosamine 1-carboxyvinyltransferase [Apilactobacillus ozensis]|uniref:UDP-N-acetylglucosamine 1-carboxyvinyltransferase n=1 Tax=Apilactobacillus ozensis TaxID=866801 RepID=UPI00200B9B2C|nr:UDP-N-acetylglucosamine 1-carboxyvinyltransferase [Apilactobacillus ozensis]MCK8607570.1 UDP-N-acetylglucosamine 1-carboxyvinyltransferase [Apilactobacillus ozensis]
MTKMIIHGGTCLSGDVTIGGAKNSTVALIPAAILADTPVQLNMVPDILDVHNLMLILKSMNVRSEFADGMLTIDPTNIVENILPSKAIKSLRASYYFMGALLGKFGEATLSFPGGDNIGPRPIDQHIKAFEALGADVTNNNGTVHIKAGKKGLHGAQIFLDLVSVGATINAILAAVKVKGSTVIRNAAKEPEIIDIVTFLNNMGAKIRGAGTDVIRIEGVEKLEAKNTHIVIPDRIEAGTYLSLAAACGDGVTVHNVIPEHLESFIAKLLEMGVDLEVNEDSIFVPKCDHFKGTEIKTMVYPGFATDLQQPITPLLLKANSRSIITDTIYPERTKHIPELSKMGANIKYRNGSIVIEHTDKLTGQEVSAGEIRAGAAAVIAGIMAEGTTTIYNADNILRGYDNIVDKLTELNADVELLNDDM